MAAERESRRKTRIVATVGPRAEQPGELERLVEAGVDVVRLNGAHVKPGEVTRRVALVRAVEKKLGRSVGVLLDLGGPKIRVGPLTVAVAAWKVGDPVEIVPGSAPGDARRFSVTYPALIQDVSPGAEIRIDDGKVRLKVVSRSKGSLRATVLTPGQLRQGAGVNFPHSSLSAPALTPKDRRDLAEGLSAGVDLVGLSFVRKSEHVRSLRRLMSHLSERQRPWIVAKIERPEALADLEEIARATDVMMVARGDLGVEIGLAAVPAAQRRILSVGRRLGVPVIVATQMLESMIENPGPTRAEVSDVATAVHDGADAVMLSGETAIGAFPVEAVTTMAEIARTAEEADDPCQAQTRPLPQDDYAGAVISMAALAARTIAPQAVVVYTLTGRTARLLSKEPVPAPIVALTSTEEVCRKTCVLRNVVAYTIPRYRSVDDLIRSGEEVLLAHGLDGQTIVEVSGMALIEGAANTVRIRNLPAAPPVRARRARGG